MSAAWRWLSIEATEDVTGDVDPSEEQVRYDERWLAKVLLAKQRNAGTRAGYRRDINTFMDWWQQERDRQLSAACRPLEASRSDLEQYTAWLAAREPPLAAATRARKLSVVSSFYELAEEHDLIGKSATRRLRRPTVENEDARLGLEAGDADRLLGAAESWSEQREGTLIALLLLCGFRISEALAITPVDITPRGDTVELRIKRKARDHKTAFFVDDHWLIERLTDLRERAAANESVFGPIDRFRANRVLAAIGARAGLDPPPHPHLLRHTFCAHLLMDGMDVREVQKLAGHRSIATTQRYADAIRARQRPVAARLRRVFKDVQDDAA